MSLLQVFEFRSALLGVGGALAFSHQSISSHRVQKNQQREKHNKNRKLSHGPACLGTVLILFIHIGFLRLNVLATNRFGLCDVKGGG